MSPAITVAELIDIMIVGMSLSGELGRNCREVEIVELEPL